MSHGFNRQRGSHRMGSMAGALCGLCSLKLPARRCVGLGLMTCLAMSKAVALSSTVPTRAASHTLTPVIGDAQVLSDPFDEFLCNFCGSYACVWPCCQILVDPAW